MYIVRRFFRIFPVFLLLFALSIPGSLLLKANVVNAHHYYSQEWVGLIDAYWTNLRYHLPLHLFMFHGVVPEHILPRSPTAFLGPAWSLSLEWQFYLIAPLWFSLAVSQATWKRLLMYGACCVVIVTSKRFIPHIEMDAALPLRVEYFFVGLISYLVYRSLSRSNLKGDVIFPSALILALALFKASHRGTLMLLPFCLWIAFMGLLLEPASSASSRWFAPIFSNPLSAWLGKISYSIYLCHSLVVWVAQWALFQAFPNLTRVGHLVSLTAITLVTTVGVSAALYYGIEAPGIRLGKRLTEKKAARQPAEPVAEPVH